MSNTNRRPNQLRAFLVITFSSLIAQTRNRATFFFGFLFPIVFISIFGLIGNGNQTITIGVPSDQQQTPIAVMITKTKFVKVDTESNDTLQQKLIRGKVDGIVNITQTSSNPPQYIVKVQTSNAQPQQAISVIFIVRTIVDQMNLSLSHVTHPSVILTQSSVEGRQARYIDFALPGMIGFSLLSTAIFGTVFGLIFLKKSLVIKRMFATPMEPLTFLFAQGTSRLIIAIIQTIVILTIGVLVFHFYLPHGFKTFLELIVLGALGLTAFLGFGYFTAGLVNDENSANPMINLITLPQFLLSGTFFPTDNLPGWIQPVANNLPLSYFNEAIRKITTEGDTFHSTFPYLSGLIIWGGIMYILASRTFKWE